MLLAKNSTIQLKEGGIKKGAVSWEEAFFQNNNHQNENITTQIRKKKMNAAFAKSKRRLKNLQQEIRGQKKLERRSQC